MSHYFKVFEDEAFDVYNSDVKIGYESRQPGDSEVMVTMGPDGCKYVFWSLMLEFQLIRQSMRIEPGSAYDQMNDHELVDYVQAKLSNLLL